MRILKAKPIWYETYDNMPSMQILVDSYAPKESMKYEKRGDLYFAESGGYVSFYYYSKPGEGFGGRVFDITLTDDSKVSLRGPWSSNPATMNAAGFTPSTDVLFTSEIDTWERGYTFHAGHITVKLFQDACKIAGVFCVEQDGSFYPSLLPCGVVKLWTPFNTKRTIGRWMPPHGKEASVDLSEAQNAVVIA